MGRYAWIYEGEKWRKVRQYVIARDMGLCQMCKAAGIVKPGIEVDHIVPIDDSNCKDWDVVYNLDNLRLLCHDCHNARHDRVGAGLTNFMEPIENFQTSAETLPPGSK